MLLVKTINNLDDDDEVEIDNNNDDSDDNDEVECANVLFAMANVNFDQA
jgi:hypothetical protein